MTKLWRKSLVLAMYCLSLISLGCGTEPPTDVPSTSDREEQEKGYFNGGDFDDDFVPEEYRCAAKSPVSGEIFYATGSTKAKAQIAAREQCEDSTGRACVSTASCSNF